MTGLIDCPFYSIPSSPTNKSQEERPSYSFEVLKSASDWQPVVCIIREMCLYLGPRNQA